MTGRYLGIGISHYRHYRPLSRAVTDVDRVAKVLRGLGMDCTVWPNATDADLRRNFRTRLGEAPKQIVIHWAGHAHYDGVAFGLATGDTPTDRPNLMQLTDPVGLLHSALSAGARQVLMILDTCYAGAGLGALNRLATRFEEAQEAAEERIWVGLVGSARSYEQALDGRFAERLLKLLSEGPDGLAQRRRWSAHNAGVSGDDLITALQDEWPPDAAQQLKVASQGVAKPLLPNPWYVRGAPERFVDTRLHSAALGVGPGEDGSFFTGRRRELDQIANWLCASEPGVMVVTGAAGSGKSALLGQVALRIAPGRRAPAPASPDKPSGEADLASVRADVVMDVRGQSSSSLLGALNARLGEGHAASVHGLLDSLIARAERPVIVLDALDEVQNGTLRSVVGELLLPLSGHALVLVGTRDKLVDGSTTLMSLMMAGKARVCDLDCVDDTRSDVTDYVAARLAGTANREVPKIAAELAERALSATGAFLYARMVTSQLRAQPVDTGDAGWRDSLAGSFGAVLDAELAAAARNPPPCLTGVPAASTARHLLSALAWSFGGGLPALELWPALAEALAGTGVRYGRADVDWVLDHFGHYLVESGEQGQAVYRLFHQELADHLARDTADGRRLDEAVVRMLLDHAADHGGTASVDPYVERHAVAHLIRQGPDGVAVAEGLMRSAPETYRPVFADVLHDVSLGLADSGQWGVALPLAERAAVVRLELARQHPGSYLPDLTASLDHVRHLNTRLARVEEGSRWLDQVISGFMADAVGRALLLVWRCQTLMERLFPARFGDAVGALDLLTGEPGGPRYEAALHSTRTAIRRLYDGSPAAFEELWATRDDPLPEWLSQARLRPVILEWLGKPSLGQSRAYAAAHPEIFTEQGATVLDELSATLEPEFVESNRRLLRQIADLGLAVAYQHLDAEITANAWMALAPDWDASNDYLRSRRATLVGEASSAYLANTLAGHPDDLLVAVHRNLVVLARHHAAHLGYLLLTGDGPAARQALWEDVSVPGRIDPVVLSALRDLMTAAGGSQSAR
ncbi:AAA family ATPase [Streptomyces xanthophaeus]|uniref:AAA family ATPase n=1 Tax=Streptomyces xanthophaeus TaxID=67385 RepID=UPI00398FE107